MMVICCLFSFAMPRAEAAPLTQQQQDSILNLLQSFGASQTVIDNVKAALNGGASNSTSVTVVAPNGEATYYYGQQFTILWSQKGSVPKGSKACVVLKGEETKKHFAFPPQGECVDVTGEEGVRSVTGLLMRTQGYDLAPGAYRALVTVTGPSNSGKDGPTLAQDQSDFYFKIAENTSRHSITVASPNGGEKITINEPHVIKWEQQGLKNVSIALYRNDQWKQWIVKDLVTEYTGSLSHTWMPAQTDINTRDFKIYITGQKMDGTGYADDKSDAPFSFVAAPTKARTGTISTTHNARTVTFKTPIQCTDVPPGRTDESINFIDVGNKTNLVRINVPCGSGVVSYTYPADGEYTATLYTASFGTSEIIEKTKRSLAQISLSVTSVPAPTCTMTASKSTMTKGETVLLSWTSTNAVSAVVQGVSKPVQGGWNVSPNATYTYLGTFTGANGQTVVCTKTINVLASTSSDTPSTPSIFSGLTNYFALIGGGMAAIGEGYMALFDFPRKSAPGKSAPATTNEARARTLQNAPKMAAPALCELLARTIRKGSVGEDVAHLQRFLQQTGDFKEASTTTYFGPATERALQAWQARTGIVSDGDAQTTGFGALGPMTRKALVERCRAMMGDKKTQGTAAPATTAIDPKVAPTCVLTASPSVVVAGEPVVLTWESKNATHTGSANGEKGPVRGSLKRTPTETITYVKKVYGPGGEGQCSAVVEVANTTPVTEPEVVVAPSATGQVGRVLSLMGSGVAAVFEGYISLFDFNN